jgi:hypothetical protein
VVVIPGGTDVTVVGTVSGSVVNGSGTWYEVVYNGQNVFVHGSLLVANSGQSVSQPVILDQVSSQPPQQSSGSGIPVPLSGIWTITLDSTSNFSCADTGNVAFPTVELYPELSFTGSMTVARDGTSLILDGDTFVLQADNTYVGSWTFTPDVNGQLYLNVQSPTFITGHVTWNATVDGVACSSTTNTTIARN